MSVFVEGLWETVVRAVRLRDSPSGRCRSSRLNRRSSVRDPRVQPSSIGGGGRSTNFPSLLPSWEVVAHRVSSAAGRGRRSQPAAEAGGRSKFPRSSEAVGDPGASAPGSPLMARTVRKPAVASPRSLSPIAAQTAPGLTARARLCERHSASRGRQPPDRPVRTDVPPARDAIAFAAPLIRPSVLPAADAVGGAGWEPSPQEQASGGCGTATRP